MGNICGIDPFQLLLKEYGDDVAKFIAIQKGKELLDKEVKVSKGKMREEIGVIKKSAFQQVDKGEVQLEKKMEESISSIGDDKIKLIEKLKGEKIESILGINALKDEFAELRTTADKKFVEEEGVIMKQIDEVKDSQQKKMDEVKPSLPIYDQLPQKQQKEVFKKGEKKFAKQIQEHQEEMMKEVKESLNPQKYTNKVKNIIDMKPYTEKIDKITETVDDVKKLASGGGVGGFIGGIF